MRRKGLSAYALKDVLGIKSVNHIDVWSGKKPLPELERPKEDQGWLPLVHILKICNTYPNDVTLGDFIEGADEDVLQEKCQPEQVAASHQHIIDEKNREITTLQQKIMELKELVAELRTEMANQLLASEKTIGQVKDQMREKMTEREDKIRREYDEKVMEVIKSFAAAQRNNHNPSDKNTDKIITNLMANEPIEPPIPEPLDNRL